MIREGVFRFRQFELSQRYAAQKFGTDALLLGAWRLQLGESPQRILDVGTGTGVLALMQAQRYPEARVEGWELEPAAAAEAAENFAHSPFAPRLSLQQTDFAMAAETCAAASYDLIISNPPYYTTDTLAPEAARALARHTQTTSLSPEQLLRLSLGLLRPDGVLAMVTPAEQLEMLRRCAVAYGWYLAELVAVYSQPQRLVRSLTAWRRLRDLDGYQPCLSSELLLHEAGGEQSAAYRAWTSDYLLPHKMNL